MLEIKPEDPRVPDAARAQLEALNATSSGAVIHKLNLTTRGDVQSIVIGRYGRADGHMITIEKEEFSVLPVEAENIPPTVASASTAPEQQPALA